MPATMPAGCALPLRITKEKYIPVMSDFYDILLENRSLMKLAKK